MDKFEPTIIHSLKKYNRKKLVKDVYSGILVAVIALPLSIPLAIASGVRPENGLYSAIIGGFFVSMLSGSRVQIGGITAATVMIVSKIISQYGMNGLAIASIMAGIMLVILGFLQFGSLLKYIPLTITTGFTVGIGIGIFTSQIKEFFGLTIVKMPISIPDKWGVYFHSYHTINWMSVLISVISLAILLMIPKITKKIPNSLVMIIIVTLGVNILQIPVNTVSSVYGTLPSRFPPFVGPVISFELIENLLVPSFSLAILISLVSLLSCVVTDGIIGKRHNSNMELVAQGIANIFCGLFRAVPVAGAVARSSNSIKNGGKSQVVGIVHSIVICGVLLLMIPLVGYIPLSCLAALLIVVSIKMINFDEILYTIKSSPKSDIAVLFVTISIAIFVDLMAAVGVGLLIAAILFIRRMADVPTVEGWRYIEDEMEYPESDSIELKEVPKDTQVYEICGPMFFASSEKILSITPNEKCRNLIIRMRTVTSIDTTSLRRLEHLWENCKKHKITLILSHVNEQPLNIMKKSGLDEKIGLDNFCDHIDEALARAASL